MSLTMCSCHWSDLRPFFLSIELMFYVAMYIYVEIDLELGN